MGTLWSREQEGEAKAAEKQEKSQEEQQENVPEKPKKLPHNYQDIVKEADPPVQATAGDLDPRLYKGVLLGNKRMYWVDKHLCNCFMLLARGLSITWSEDCNYWEWVSMKHSRLGIEIEVARLLDVCWLEVHGAFKTSNLSPGVLYEVAFEVKMEEPCYGWKAPVNLKLVDAEGKTQEHVEKLDEKPKGQWIQLPAGDFVSPRENGGEIQFSLFEHQDGQWKRGLVIKGVVLQPKECEKTWLLEIV